MAVDPNPPSRGNLAIIVATAAVTVAVGVTIAALAGYLKPGRDTASQQSAIVEPAAATAPALAPVTPTVPVAPAAPALVGPTAPSVVLVPVQPDPRAQPAATPPAPELLLAVDPAISADTGAYYGDDDDDDEDEEREHGRRHHREHDDDED